MATRGRLPSGRSAAARGRGSARVPRPRRAFGVVALGAQRLRAHQLAGERAVHEDDVPLQAGDPAPPCATPSIRQLDQVAAPWPLRPPGAGAGSVPGPVALDMPLSWHAVGPGPRHLRGAGGAVRGCHGPRVLPAFRRSQAPSSRSSRYTSATPGCSGAAWSTSCGSALPRRRPGIRPAAARYLFALAVGGPLGNGRPRTRRPRSREREAVARGRGRGERLPTAQTR